MGAYGEAGIVLARSEEHAAQLRALRDHGQDTKNSHRFKGFNYRMEALQGAVLRVKLRHLEEWSQGRRERARLYDSLLEGSGVELPRAMPGAEHVYHLYVVRASNRDDLQKHLAERKIETGVHYPLPVHLQEGFRDLGYAEGAFPVAEACARSVLSLPMYAEVTEAQVGEVAEAVRSFARR
jgi:dTDP-4-amino-4,6-dideoxygalactose transaminase